MTHSVNICQNIIACTETDTFAKTDIMYNTFPFEQQKSETEWGVMVVRGGGGVRGPSGVYHILSC